MKLRQKLMLVVFLAALMLGTVGHAEQSAMIQDVGIGQEGGTRWDCTGRWYVTYAEYQGVPDPSAPWENYVLQINPDGTAEGMTQGVVEARYTWCIEDECLQVYQDSVRIETCYAVDGHLVSIDGGAVIIFGRSASAEAGIPAVVPAASLDAFDGTWGDACILKGDVWIPQSLSHMYTGIVIDDGMMTLFFSVGQSGLFDQPAGSCQMMLKDGMLYADDGQYVALHEGGYLSLHTGDEIIYLTQGSPETSAPPEQTATRIRLGQNTIAAGGNHTAAVREDGTVMAVGCNEYGECDVGGWTDITAVGAGKHHTVGLKADGTVVAAGWNEYGQCDVSDWRDIAAISVGRFGTVGLKNDGTVVAVGEIWSDQNNVRDWRDIVAVSAGECHIIGQKADGTVVALGLNLDGQCNVSDWTDYIAISAGSYFTIGLKADGTVTVIGKSANRYNVSDWRDIVAISAGNIHTVGLKADGTVVATGANGCGQCEVSDWTDIVAISAGGLHTVGLKADGTMVAVGHNSDGQCNIQP